MRARTFSIAVFLATTTTACSQEGVPVLSAQDCALLNAEYGVTPPGCVAPQPMKASNAAARRPPPSVVVPSRQLTDEMRENHVFFSGGGSALDEAARTQLTGLINLLNGPRLTSACIRLVGHSDRSGSAAGNRTLSEQRAQMVAAFLAAALGTSRITAVEGVGFDQPLTDFPPEARENRRVAIYLGPCSTIRAQ
jgi:outer membrane protein OmpA-like peptidoglycan-associated protein